MQLHVIFRHTGNAIWIPSFRKLSSQDTHVAEYNFQKARREARSNVGFQYERERACGGVLMCGRAVESGPVVMTHSP
jgi:hypothetical protein